MRVGVVQFCPLFGGVGRNIAKAVSLVRQAEKADLWVLPELFATGYQFCDRGEVLALSEDTSGPTIDTMVRKAAELGCWFCGGFPERSGRRVYNSAFLVGPDGLEAVYRKVHLFGREKELFMPGDLGFAVHTVAGVRVGMMICFDWLFPESARTLMLGGAQVLLHPSNLVLPHCPDAMKTRALENRVFTVTANRTGSESRVPGETLTYIGQSVIWTPRGEALLRLGVEEERAAAVEVDVRLAAEKRVTPYNDLVKDRRCEFYRSE
ncbi:MAG: acyltransferase [Deltaproteobacteria bacterium]|nr:acyltransferase [Deltaproteobacteria bacterium]